VRDFVFWWWKKKVAIREGSQTLPARPYDRSSLEIKLLKVVKG